MISSYIHYKERDKIVMEVTVDLLKRIEDSYKSFSKGQKRIADYICNNYDKAVHLTAARMGNIVGVSESTVVRFATELGFKGYPQFQKALEEISKNRLNTIQRMTLINNRINQEHILSSVLHSDYENIKQTREAITNEEFDKAVDALASASRIYIVGGRSSEVLARFLEYYLNYIFDNVKMITTNSLAESLEDVHRISDKDVIVGISFPRYSLDTVRIMEYSKKRGAYVVALTDSAASPMVEFSDCNLFAKSDMVSFADSLVAPMSVINALIAALSIKNQEYVVDTMKTLENIWDEYGVYKKQHIHEV